MTVPDEVEAQVLDKATYVEEAVSVLAAKQSLDEEEDRAPSTHRPEMYYSRRHSARPTELKYPSNSNTRRQ